MADEEYNPFMDESDPVPVNNGSSNPFGDDEDDDDFFNDHQVVSPSAPSPPQIKKTEEEKPVIQVEDKRLSYTSLDEQHQVTTIMRSVSMEDDLGLSEPLSESKDLFVKVDSPEKHVEGYVSYSVLTQTTRSDYDESEYKVRRRYQDFLWLRQKLEETFPTHVVPPLPEKFTFSKHITDKFEPDFLKTRQKALDKFMNRVVDHAVMSFCDHLKTFLTAKAWEMTTARKKQPGAASKVGGSVRNTAAQLMMKNREEEFTEMGKYNIQFQGKMKNLETIADAVAQERFYLMDDYAEYASGFRLWANSESRLSDPLTACASSLDKCCENLKKILRVHDQRICEPIREYILYCEAVKLALKRRDQVQIEHELATEELQKRRDEKEQIESSGQTKSISTFFGKDPEVVKEEKLAKLNQQIRDLVSETEVLSDKHATADQDFRAEMERWNETKKRDLKALFLEIAERHIKFYEQNVEAWQSSYDVISKPKV